jgi:hypothetical protein
MSVTLTMPCAQSGTLQESGSGVGFIACCSPNHHAQYINGELALFFDCDCTENTYTVVEDGKTYTYSGGFVHAIGDCQ